MSSAFRNALKGFAVVAAFLPAIATAQFLNEGYLTDKDGNVVKAVGNTVCVRTSEWTPRWPPPPRRAKSVLLTSARNRRHRRPQPNRRRNRKRNRKRNRLPKSVEPVNVELKIELQGIAFNKVELTADNKKELDEFLDKEVKPLNDDRRGDHHRSHRPHRQRQVQQEAVREARALRQGLHRQQRHRPETDLLGRQRQSSADPGDQVLR